jgi:thiosulfate/3-mercaptopyruvate sulfurtransferase
MYATPVPASRDWLVSAARLAARLGDPRLVVVDMRWREDGSGPQAYAEGHIPGAVFLDWATDLADPRHPVAFMLAPPERFRAAMERSGIGDRSVVVAYADPLGSGPYRLWWGCRVYGHDNVRVLDGGLARWVAEGGPLSAERPTPRPATWTPRPTPGLVATAREVEGARRGPGVVVLDSRPPEQYRGLAVWFEAGPVPAGNDGIARTPRGAIRAGRVPWAASVPAAALYRKDGTMKGRAELRALFARAGVGPGTRAIAYCGCGISASALLFALARAGIEASLYDGSWEEWGRDPRRPVARG